jgi:hypothetical protein
MIAGAVLGCIILIALFLFWPTSRSSFHRINIVMATTPVSVWSWNKDDGTFDVIAIPSDTTIDSVHGYGKYSLEALWKLGFIDSKDSAIFSDSVSDALGIPLRWYAGASGEALEKIDHPVQYGRGFSSLSNTVGILLGRYRTNLPVGLFMSFAKALSSTRADDITFIDLSQKYVTYDEDLPDDTKRSVLETEALDVVLKGVFEDDRIRKEALSVAMYNTTQTPALANRAARLLANSGVLVLSVGNESQEVSRCQVQGDKSILSSQTAIVIAEILDCDRVPSKEERRTDLSVRVGTAYADLFVSRAKKDN